MEKNCAGLYQSGVAESGVYYISPLHTPVTVFCDMDQDLKYIAGMSSAHSGKTGITIVSHNLWAQTQIRGRGIGDIKKVITYRY